jgi:Cu2+-exporting ATPase
MLLSVSVWAGLWSDDMGPATRGLLHWISALIVLPAVAWAGRPFFRSAFRAMSAGRANMDVPISLAIMLSLAVSVVGTAHGAEHAWFDAAATLLFFLLVGRYLDRRARSRACSAAERLLLLRAATATVVDQNGRRRTVPAEALREGLRVAVAAGERIPADGELVSGTSAIDTALVTGESQPRSATIGDKVFAGTVNLAAPVEMIVRGAGEATLLAEIVRLIEAAEQGKARYVRLADRAARLYAPFVHVLAAATFLGWIAAGHGWQVALLHAVAVLIITCPCALGLAVPAVQVVASGRLFARGVLMKSADGLERLAAADTVVFDKTGTLTLGRPRLVNRAAVTAADLAAAASLATVSRHPLSRALARAAEAEGIAAMAATDAREVPGRGVAVSAGGVELRLGRRDWCGVAETAASGDAGASELWLSRSGAAPVRFCFADSLRPDAGAVIAELRRRGYSIELLSGDRPEIAGAVATALGIADWRGGATPADKAARLAELAAAGRTVLMVGDGLNDAPALAAAQVSMSPAAAADVSQTAADFIFQGDRLAPLVAAVDVARSARRLVLQNFALAIGYNLVAVPFAMAGLVTPLIAALAMSSSSLLVTGNALRLKLARIGGDA